MCSTLHIRFLGGFGLEYGDRPVTTLNTSRQQSLLAYLVLHRQTPLTRDRVAFQLWPDAPESRARANLRALLYRLRQNIPTSEQFLNITDQTIQWRPDASFELDVAQFEQAIAQATLGAALQEALALYSGDLLPGCYDDWVMPLRERLRQRYLEGLVRVIGWLEADGDYAGAIGYARQLLRYDPLREESHRTLMRLHALSGNRAAAVRVYQECVATLRQELEVPPSRSTRELYERIEAGSVVAETGSGLKPAPRHNLPAQPTPLIGRQAELVRLQALLAEPDCRLLSIVGTGGIGKTRLALELAHQTVDRYPGGVYFVSLAGVDLVEDIISKIALTITPSVSSRFVSRTEFLTRLRQTDLEQLLVLDNFEQLLPDGIETLQALLTGTRRLKLVVTSREVLNMRWEWRVELEELSYPAAGQREDLQAHGAVQLFLHIAQRILPRRPLSSGELREVGQICRLVAGMPLGVELAAAQTGRLSLARIAAELERNLATPATSVWDLPARQRSLRASFDTSWRSLTAAEQQLLARLSVFRAGFTAEAAETVAGASLALLASLVDKSLLRQGLPGRYFLHEVLRRFAAEELVRNPADLAHTRNRCRAYFLDFLEEKRKVLFRDQDVRETVAATNAELENLWTVLRWDLAPDETREYGISLDRLWSAVDWNEAYWDQFYRFKNAPDTVERHRRRLADPASELRVVHIDIVWLEALADQLRDLSHDLAGEARQHFGVYVESCTVHGKLVALPYYADLGLLRYRTDLLTAYGYAGPPTTWDELEVMAARIQAGERARGHTDFWGFIWQGNKYEGLTCNALEWQVSHGGGRLIEPDGVITINNPQAIAAFERAARWVGTISPADVTQYDEWTSWEAWFAGKAAFMRNWATPFYKLEDAAVNLTTIGIARLPAGPARRAATIGGECVALPLLTPYPQEAAAQARLAASPEAQFSRAKGDLPHLPTISTLYDHPQLLAAHPHFSVVKLAVASDAVTRPSKVTGALYPRVSDAYATAVHSILTGQADAATAVAGLEAELIEITGFPAARPGSSGSHPVV